MTSRRRVGPQSASGRGPRRSLRVAALVVALAGAGAGAGCGSFAVEPGSPAVRPPTATGAPRDRPEPTVSGRSSADGLPAPAGERPSGPVLSSILTRTGWNKVAGQIGGRAGLVVIRRTSHGSEQVELGRVAVGVAWSTAKIPVAMAALRATPGPTTRERARRAITASDNQAAQALWASLGSPARAAALTQRELRRLGDDQTRVESRRLRAGFSAFGQTRWALADQAVAVGALPCTASAELVLGDMQAVIGSQRWGFGAVRGAAIKGGWGPYASGSGYLVRQVAVFRTTDGALWSVAAAVDAPAGFSAGVSGLDRTAAWVRQRLEQADLAVDRRGPRCP